MARSSPYRLASSENGATLTEHSPSRVVIRAGVVLPDELQRAGELLHHDRLSFHSITKIKTLISHVYRCSDSGTVVRRQEGFENRRTNRVPAASNVEWELGACSRTLDAPPPCHCGQTRRR
jgi:hypothetical protein